MPKNAIDHYELKNIFGINDRDFLDFYDKEHYEKLSKDRKAYPSTNIDLMLSNGDLDYYFMGKKFVFKKNKHKSFLKYKFRKLLYLRYIKGIFDSYDINSLLDNHNAYFDEYPHNSDIHFSDCSDLVKKAFIFPPFKDEKNLQTQRDMEKTESVAIHIRRTDHTGDNKRLFKTGFYKKAVTIIKEQAKTKPVFYVFSDDLVWCNNNKNILGLCDDDSIVFVDWNRGKENNYKDMQLMTFCQHNVVPISSFSWWGYYLSKRENKIVIAPKKYWSEIKIHI